MFILQLLNIKLYKTCYLRLYIFIIIKFYKERIQNDKIVVYSKLLLIVLNLFIVATKG